MPCKHASASVCICIAYTCRYRPTYSNACFHANKCISVGEHACMHEWKLHACMCVRTRAWYEPAIFTPVYESTHGQHPSKQICSNLIMFDYGELVKSLRPSCAPEYGSCRAKHRFNIYEYGQLN